MTSAKTATFEPVLKLTPQRLSARLSEVARHLTIALIDLGVIEIEHASLLDFARAIYCEIP